jgi:hypothetical protein
MLVNIVNIRYGFSTIHQNRENRNTLICLDRRQRSNNHAEGEQKPQAILTMLTVIKALWCCLLCTSGQRGVLPL